MLKKLDIGTSEIEQVEAFNALVDAVNKLHEEAENNARIRAKHENLINTLVVENNIHEEQIDELQMKLEPEKCETPADNSGKVNCQENVQPDAESRPVNVQDKFAEQRKWEGKLCWVWDEDPEDKIVDVLSWIDTSDKYPYVICDHQIHYKHCEPVKPDDDIIYKGV